MFVMKSGRMLMTWMGLSIVGWLIVPVVASRCQAQDVEFELRAPGTPDQPVIPGRIQGSVLEMSLAGDVEPMRYRRDITLDSESHWGFRSFQSDHRPIRVPRGPGGWVWRLLASGTWRPTIYIAVRPAPPAPAVADSVRRTVRSREPLEAASAWLVNRHENELHLVVRDLSRPKQNPERIVLKTGESAQREFSRDPGAVETLEVLDQFGQVLETAETEIEPKPLYVIEVHESRIQSLYLDRTGTDQTAPSRFRPPEIEKGTRSIGMFSVPAGRELKSGAQLDVLRMAKSQQNPGAANTWAIE